MVAAHMRGETHAAGRVETGPLALHVLHLALNLVVATAEESCPLSMPSSPAGGLKGGTETAAADAAGERARGALGADGESMAAGLPDAGGNDAAVQAPRDSEAAAEAGARTRVEAAAAAGADSAVGTNVTESTGNQSAASARGGGHSLQDVKKEELHWGFSERSQLKLGTAGVACGLRGPGKRAVELIVGLRQVVCVCVCVCARARARMERME